MSGPSLSRVGVVVVTYQSAEDVAAALSPLPATELARIVVVDNASPDDTVEIVRRLQIPNLEIVEQANVGFGLGNNAGRAALPSDAEFVLLLNPDCVIEAADLETLVDYITARPRCALVGPRVVGVDGAAKTPAGALPTPMTEFRPLMPRVLGRFLPRRQLPGETQTQPVGYVEGACMLLRLAAFDEVEGFDDRFFLCFEEIDLAKRMRDAGWDVELCGAAVAMHAGQRSRATRPLFSVYHQHRSQRLYIERWYGTRAANRFARAVAASWWLRSRLGRETVERYRVVRAAVTGAEFPS